MIYSFHHAVLVVLGVVLMGAAALGADAPAGAGQQARVTPALPDPLTFAGGGKVTTAQDWAKRRAEILELFTTQVYGRSPGKPAGMTFEVASSDPQALGGKATRKQVWAYFTGKKDGPRMSILIYLPNDAKKPAPMFLGMNFNGNQAVCADAGIALPTQWRREGKKGPYKAGVAAEDSRGKDTTQWQVQKILSRGFGLATIYYGDVEPDFDGGLQHGVRKTYLKDGATTFADDEWGAIAAWAWGLSRAMDYLETDADVDAKHVAVMGHSRLGKTAVWAGAQDQRFAMVISNDSGCGGAALFRGKQGESLARITTAFPHWFCGNFKKYAEQETSLPVDQHELLALVAPRPLYVASADQDKWADPFNEFQSARAAECVYLLLGTEGLGVSEMPAVDHPVGKTIGYHIRTGKHDVLEFDWEQYLNFAGKQWGR